MNTVLSFVVEINRWKSNIEHFYVFLRNALKTNEEGGTKTDKICSWMMAA